ncbi:MAG: exosortase-associated EpsI family protein [Pirellulales bacterium]
MMRFAPIGAGLALIIACTIFQGKVLTDRWNAPSEEELQAYSDRMQNNLPKDIGDWEGENLEPEKNDKDWERQIRVAKVVGNLSRRYRNTLTGKTVDLFMVCGKPGNVAMHTPDICYVAAGFRMEESPYKYPIQTGSANPEFFTTRFVKESQTSTERLRIFWSWSADGNWQAPTVPKWTFARAPALYKMYVISHMSKSDDPIYEDPAIDFVKALVPELQQKVFPAAEKAAE